MYCVFPCVCWSKNFAFMWFHQKSHKNSSKNSLFWGLIQNTMKCKLARKWFSCRFSFIVCVFSRISWCILPKFLSTPALHLLHQPLLPVSNVFSTHYPLMCFSTCASSRRYLSLYLSPVFRSVTCLCSCCSVSLMVLNVLQPLLFLLAVSCVWFHLSPLSLWQ